MAIKLALVSSTGVSGVSSNSNEDAETRQELLDGCLYTEKLILTYHAALCGVVLIFTSWHWYGKLAKRRRRKHWTSDSAVLCRSNRVGNVSPSDSSGSTSSGNATPSELAKTHERSPLLTKEQTPPKSGFLRNKVRAIRALAMYQLRPIPIANKTLPQNSTTLLVLTLLGLNMFYAVYNIHWKFELAFVWSDRMAMLFVANLPWLYILGAKNHPLKGLTGYSYENLNILHRRLGEVLCLLAVFHAIGMLMVWYCFFRPTGMLIWSFLAHKVVWPGVVAFVCYELLYVTSLASFREWWYEVFLGSHVVLQAGGLLFVYLHHRGGRTYTLVALAIFLADRLILRLTLKSRSFKASLAVMEDDETFLVSADWPLILRWSKLSTLLLGMNVRYGWKPTEHVFLTVPALERKHAFQAHPFTIASAAPENEQQHAWFNLIVRAHDGFTRDLLEYARNYASVMVRLDGPYGSLHALNMLRSSDVALLVVGGSGIAVAYPLLWTLLHNADAEAAQISRRRVGLVWIVHNASHVSWIGHERIDELRAKGLHLCIPPPTSKAGRPDVDKLVRNLIQKMLGDEPIQDPKIGVVVSGPNGMNRAARNACASLACHGTNIDVSVEKYGW